MPIIALCSSSPLDGRCIAIMGLSFLVAPPMRLVSLLTAFFCGRSPIFLSSLITCLLLLHSNYRVGHIST